MPLRRLLLASCVIALVIMACGVSVDLGLPPSPAPSATSTSQDNIATMVAQTVQAFGLAQSSATPTNTATPTVTPLPPTLSVSKSTDCYGGPSTNYGFVITIYPGATVTVAGRDPIDNYWIINVPNYPGTICWLSGQYAMVTGETGNVPVPATPVISLYTLSEPRALHFSCTSEPLSGTPEPWWHDAAEWTVNLHWVNTDPDQTGVRVYRDGWRVATIRGHGNSFTDTLFHDRHDHDVTYGVQAFNSGQVSSIVTIEVNHCG